MRAWILAIVAGLGLVQGGTAAAQQQLGSYYALLGPRDMVNSRGERLTDICQVVQQDRANWHRFGLRDEYDTGDPFFGSVEARQVISQICVLPPQYDYIRREVLGGTPRFVYVQVFGSGGRITSIVVNEGAG
jgi:hypothetical protein